MFISSGSYVYCTGDALNKIDPWGLGEGTGTPTQGPGTSPPFDPGGNSPMIVGHEDEYYRGVGVWLYDIAIGRYLRGLGATGDGIGSYGSGPGQSWVAPPRGIGPGGKGGVEWPGAPYSLEYSTSAQRPWMIHATGELGVSEFDPGDNPRILEYHAAVNPNFVSDQTPWCASFVTWSLQRAGIMEFASASAAKWIGFGMRLSKPEYGAIAVYRRVTRNGKVQNHVAFIAGVNREGSIVLLGGNQSDMVSLSTPRGGMFLYFGLPTGFIPTGYLPLIGGRVTSGGSTR